MEVYSYQRLRTQQGGLEGWNRSGAGSPDKIATENLSIKGVWPAAASLEGRQSKESPDVDRKG